MSVATIAPYPYPGLRSFRHDEAGIFFGREEHVDQLLEKLDDHRFLAVVGASGCGKSSLVRAGMLDHLAKGFMCRAGAIWKVADMRPGTRPTENLARALLGSEILGSRWSVSDEATAYLSANLRRGPHALAELLRESSRPRGANLLLLVDQFEEIFRFHPDRDPNEASDFVELLLTTAKRQEVPVYVVITMRSDSMGECARFPNLPEMINECQFLTPRLTRQQCYEAIVEPARQLDCEIEPGLVNQILNDMGNDPDQLPLMQHALAQMWRRRRDGDSYKSDEADLETEEGTNEWQNERPAITLTLDDYIAIGRLQHALSKHADEALKELSDADQKIAEVLFRCLVEPGADGPKSAVLRHATLESVAKVAGVSVDCVKAVVERFRRTDRSFLYMDERDEIRVSHESLIRRWTTLVNWVKKEEDSSRIYRRLADTAALWKKGEAALYDTPDLDVALAWKKFENPSAAWAKLYRGRFELSLEFLDESIRGRERRLQNTQRLQQRRQRLIQLLAVVSVLIAAIFAYLNYRTTYYKAQAIDRLTDGRKSVDQFQREASDVLKYYPGLREYRLGSLTTAAEKYKRWSEEESGDQDLRLESARAAISLGDVQRDLSEIDPPKKSDYQTIAEKAYRDAEQKLMVKPMKSEAARDLAVARARLAKLFDDQGRYQDAEELFNTAIGGLRTLVETAPARNVELRYDLAITLLNLSELLEKQNRSQPAIGFLNEAIKILEPIANEDSRYGQGLARARQLLGHVRSKSKDHNQALIEFKTAAHQLKAIVQNVPGHPGYLDDLASCDVDAANELLYINRDAEERGTFYGEAIAYYDKLATAIYDVPKYRYHYATTLRYLAEYLHRLGVSPEAKSLLELAAERLDDFRQVERDNPKYLREAGANRCTLGRVLLDMSSMDDDAVGALREAVKIFEDLSAHSDDAVLVHWLSICRTDLGLAFAKKNDAIAAKEAFNSAIEGYLKLFKKNTTVEDLLIRKPTGDKEPQYYDGLARTFESRGHLSCDSQRPDAAKDYATVFSLRDKIRGDPENVDPEYLHQFSWFLANCYDTDLRSEHLELAVELAEKATERVPDSPTYRNTLGAARFRAKQFESAIEALEKAKSLRQQDFQNSVDDFFLSMAYWEMGDKKRAEKAFNEAVAVMEQNRPGNVQLQRLRMEAQRLLGITEPAGDSKPVIKSISRFVYGLPSQASLYKAHR